MKNPQSQSSGQKNGVKFEGKAILVERLRGINSISLYLLLFAAFLGPSLLVFAVGPIHLFPYRIIWLFMLLFALPYIYIQREEIQAELSRSKLYFIFLLLWLLYASLSLLWAVDKVDALRQILFLAMGISLILLVAIFFNNSLRLYQLHKLWVLTLVIIVAIGFWNMISGQQLASSSHYGTGITIPTSIFHYHNDLATYLALSLPFVLSYIRYGSKLHIRGLSLLLFMLVFVLLVATGSRANMLAVLVGAIFWFIFLIEGRTRLRVFLLTLGLGMIIAAFLYWSSSDLALIIRGSAHGGLEKLLGTFKVLSGSEGDLGISFGSRINFIRNGLVYLFNSYGFGVGAGNANHYIENYQYYYTFGYSNPHNWWLEILVNYGLLIFGGFVYYYISLLMNLYRMRGQAESPVAKILSESLLLSIVIFFFASMSPSSLFGYGFPWILFALATGFINLQRNCKEEK